MWAVITGASKGLGRAFSVELTKRGFNLILVSLPGEALESVAQECRLRGVQCDIYELDLTDRCQLVEFIESVNAKYDISMLINNAGFGGSKSFTDAPFSYIEKMLHLNVLVTTTLSHQLLPNLQRQPKSYILNISSMASLVPSGYKTVYPASKAFIRHLSLGLREELASSGVNVCVATLGPMPTHEEIIRRIEIQGIAGKLLTISPETVARRCIESLLRGDSEIVVGPFNKLSKFMISLLPSKLIGKMMTNRVRKNEIG